MTDEMAAKIVAVIFEKIFEEHTLPVPSDQFPSRQDKILGFKVFPKKKGEHFIFFLCQEIEAGRHQFIGST